MAETIDTTPVAGSGDPDPDRGHGHGEGAAPLTMERMSAELEGLRSEVERLRDLASGRGRRRNRRTRAEEAVVERAVSRRRLFGLLGGAAAAGAGMAVAGSAFSADPAGATTSVTLANGTGGTGNDAGSTTTSITSTASGSLSGGTLQAINTGTNGVALNVNTNNASNTQGGAIISSQGSGPALTVASNLLGTGTGKALTIAAKSGVPPMNIAPDLTSSGLPASPANGDLYAGDISLFYFGGGPGGSWVRMSAAVQTITPAARVYDSRVGQQPATGPKSQITNGATVNVDVTGTKAGGGSSGVPVGAFTVSGNLTVVNGPNPTFLTVFGEGAPAPATSNVNAGGGQVIANFFTTPLGASNGISIKCGGGPADFIVDIVGWSL